MVKTEELERFSAKFGIIKKLIRNDSIDKSYYHDEKYSIVLINESIYKNNKPLYRCLLAEETGFCLQGKQDAMKWAVNFLIPKKELLAAIRSNKSLNDIISEFGVTKEFFIYRIMFGKGMSKDFLKKLILSGLIEPDAKVS